MNNMNNMTNTNNTNNTTYGRRFFRYLFMFTLISFSTTALLCGKISTQDIVTLAMLIMMCFLFMDLYYPIVLY